MLQAAARLLPIFSMHWVTIQQLYHDTEAGRLAWAQPGGHDMVGLACSKACYTATTAGHDMAERGHDTTGSARARGLAGGLCRDTQYCIVTEARGWPFVTGG